MRPGIHIYLSRYIPENASLKKSHPSSWKIIGDHQNSY